MIVLENIRVEYKRYDITQPRQRILDGVNAVIGPGAQLAILGEAGSGKTTLLRLLCGLLRPSRGRVMRTSSVSFPVGFVGGSGRMTVSQYIQFVAGCYSIHAGKLRDFTVHFAELEDVLDRPTGKLEPERRARLNMTLGYALPFDFYLFDGRVVVSDPSFQKKCLKLLEARKEKSGIIVATRKPQLARQYCQSGAVLYNGSLTFYEDVERAISYYNSVSPAPRSADPYYRRTEHFDLNDDE